MKKNIIKSLLIFSIIFVLIFTSLTIVAFADSSDVKDSKNGLYKYTVNNNKATIVSYSGDETFISINRLDGRYPVEAIGPGVFSNNNTLQTIELYPSVTSISSSAFEGATALKAVTFHGTSKLVSIGDYAFYKCSSLQNFIIPESLEEIGDGAFQSCSKITIDFSNAKSLKSIGDYAFSDSSKEGSSYNITLPSTLTELGYNAFFGCTNISNIFVSSDNKVFASINGILYNKDISKLIVCPTSYVFDNDTFKLPTTVKSITSGAVSGNENVKNVILPDGIEEIGGSAFNGCIKLETINLPSSLKTIDSYAFFYCQELKSVQIPNSVTNFGIFIFRGCTNLEDVSLPDNMQEIPLGMFDSCRALSDISLPNVKTIRQYAFNYCTSLKEITIPSSVTKIESYAFRYCSSLKEFKAENVTELGSFVFQDSSSLVKVTLPKINKIPAYSFCNCTSLGELVVGNNIESIGAYAFFGCDGFIEFEILPTVKSIGDFAFGKCSNIKSFVVPSTVTYLGTGVFYSGGYESVVIDMEISKLPNRTFESCSKLKDVKLKDSVKTFGQSSFANCVNLVNIPNIEFIEHLEAYAFSGCRGITKAFFGKYDTNIPAGLYYACDNLETVTIPDIVTTIDPMAFADCTYLETVEFGENVSYVGYAAFRNCSKLRNLKLNDKLNIISEYSFYACANLTTINISKNVVFIGEKALDATRWMNLQTGDFVVSGDGILVKYQGSKTSTMISFPKTVKRIPAHIISQVSTSLTSISIPSSVTQISKNAFVSEYQTTSTTTGQTSTAYRQRYLKIIGVKGTYAEEYAKREYYTFESLF